MKSKEKQVELSQEEFDKFLNDLNEFEEKFLKHLAGNSNFEIIPTTSDTGRALTKEQITLIKSECNRLGLSILYRIDAKDGTSLIINPNNMKIGYITEGIH